jgi:hypothetical protein
MKKVTFVMKAPKGSTTAFLSKLKLNYGAESELGRVGDTISVIVTVDKRHHDEVMDKMISKGFEPVGNDKLSSISINSVYREVGAIIGELEQKGDFVLANKLHKVMVQT